ncbi:MAG: hypothetical protein JNJ81_13525 [Candidatus Accumulibacter sp.]|uniref:hypothetical protein n=1 Tax=Accumulibacter sp. TaxID=2053492 RepID=UPI001A462C85|nr:hypothetical protein [Accumulibacter sp.]MBL8408806.1 hypothetical protein [Accumulibacter sp.]
MGQRELHVLPPKYVNRCSKHTFIIAYANFETSQQHGWVPSTVQADPGVKTTDDGFNGVADSPTDHLAVVDERYKGRAGMGRADAGVIRTPDLLGLDQEDARGQARRGIVFREGAGGIWPWCSSGQGNWPQQTGNPPAIDRLAHPPARATEEVPGIIPGEQSMVQQIACIGQRMPELRMHRGTHQPRPDALLHDSHRLPLVNPLPPNHHTAP